MNAGKDSSRSARVIVALACLYAPYAWLLGDFPWDSYRWTWIRMWPVLPALLIHMLPGVHLLPDALGYVAMGLTTAPVLAIVVLAAWRSPRWSIPVSLTVLVLSVVNSWIAYQLFLF
jgi:hypothetical protein